tara:strand:+ start:50 stop:418 length:369 start_codon:yes stop_codon:yes gene_type:complete
MNKIKFLIFANLLIVFSIIYNISSKIYFEFKGGSIRIIQTYKIECGFTADVINNSFLENASKNLSMHADLCINLARLRIFNIVILSFLLIAMSIYTYVSIKNYRPYKSIDDLLKILKIRNQN